MTEAPGSTYAGVHLTDASLTDGWFADVAVRRAIVQRVRMRGVSIAETEIDGEIEGLRINGVDVGPLIEAELDRRHPGRAAMRPVDAAGFRTAWDTLESLWDGTVRRARALPPEQLHARVDDEWSFVETLRHLAYATDVWVRRVILGDPRPWHPLSLPFDGLEQGPEVPWDRTARPGLDEVLALRADRRQTVRRVIEDLTEESLAASTRPVEGPGWPPADSYPVAECLRTVLNEEWEHRLYAERDLDVLLGARS